MKNRNPSETKPVTERRRPTLADVAARAGVTKMTASRAFNKPDLVNAGTRERILAIAKEMNYLPNRFAGGLASENSRLLPLVVPSLANVVFIDVIRGAQEVLEEAGYQMLLGSVDYSLEREADTVAALLSWSPDAFILSGTKHLQRTRDLLSSGAIPVVEVMDLCDSPIDINVGISHQAAGHAMGCLLVDKGYRSFAFAGVMLDRDDRAMYRFEGFRSALREAGLADPKLLRLAGGFGPVAGATAVEQILTHSPDIDCLCFSNDDLAVGALMTCQAKNIAVPQRLAITGFNGLEIGQVITPRLTTIRSPRYQMGRVAAECALKRIHGGPLEQAILDLGFEVVDGKSA